MCSSITCLVILQDKLAAFVYVANFGKNTGIVPVESETGQEIRKRTIDMLPVQVHQSFKGAFIEVSRLIDTPDISAIYSLGQVLQKETETRNIIAIFFHRDALVGREEIRLPEGEG